MGIKNYIIKTMSYEFKDNAMQDLLQIEVKDLILFGLDLEKENIVMNFTCGSVKNTLSYS